MARTAAEIEQSIDTEASGYSELNVLQRGSSMVAFWTYAKKIIVFVALTLEKFFDQHKTDVNAIIEKPETGSIDWYLSICYAYQHGDSLIIDNNRPVYSTIDQSKQIIKRAAIKEDMSATMFFKIVKETGGELTKLDINELAAFTTYLNRRKIAGTNIDVESLDADLLDLQIEVLLDPILFDSSEKLLSDGSTEPALNALNEHLKVFDFGGTFYISRLIDSIMNIEGVKDFFITSAALNGNGFTQKMESNAGYIKLDPATQINYVLS